MRELLNTLFVQTQGAYVRLDHETLKLEVERELKLQVPLHHIGAMVLFGNVLVSPFLLHRFAEDGRSIVWLGKTGRFKGRLAGPTSGNVLLRRAQYEAQGDTYRVTNIARNVVAGKVRNARTLVQRSAREAASTEDRDALQNTAKILGRSLREVGRAESVAEVRGVEGQAGRVYFETLNRMVRSDREHYAWTGRNRRPPRDRMNALLSFVYALVLGDCVSACEGVGLDPQFGYLHALRPGRPSLGLDLMEELRPILADRLVFSLINRRQVRPSDFEERPGGAVHLREDGRKTVLVAYQKRKQEEVHHPVLDQQVPLGLVPHVQARLLARHLRGDVEFYVPFTPK
ncbi:MAG: type I-C CRISPR-associated endonuclease Cas1c [Actinomycetota bacterium]|nr:type I-C CRISPR-associated endonuclease Cas1c [Actinomycetota bacterium]